MEYDDTYGHYYRPLLINIPSIAAVGLACPPSSLPAFTGPDRDGSTSYVSGAFSLHSRTARDVIKNRGRRRNKTFAVGGMLDGVLRSTTGTARGRWLDNRNQGAATVQAPLSLHRRRRRSRRLSVRHFVQLTAPCIFYGVPLPPSIISHDACTDSRRPPRKK